MHRKKIIFLIILLSIILCLIINKNNKVEKNETSADEIILQINLDVPKDFGLLLIEYETKDASGSGGVSNANKSLIKHNDNLTYSLSKQDFNNASDITDLTLTFKIVTEYVEPNYEDNYQASSIITLNPVQINAHYGNAYHITITSDENSYQSILS